MLIQPTMQKLNVLKLHGMLEAYQSFQNNPDSNSLSFDELFSMLVDRECIYRDNKRQTRLLRDAKLRTSQASVEDINYQHPRNLEKQQLRSLVQCQWVRRKQNVIFIGPTGIGKTYLACALGQQACRQGLSVKYFRISRLFETIKTSHASGKYMIFMSQLLKADLLILDDWGLGQLNKNERQDLLEILEDRHGMKSTVITTQLPIQHWHEYIGDATIADAVLDRLLSGAHKIEMDGPSLRKKDPEPTELDLV